MSRIKLKSNAPGILGLIKSYPFIGAAMNHVAQVLLVGTHKGTMIPRWVREYIAASCSQKGHTEFCMNSHFAAALACSPYQTISELHSGILSTPKWLALEQLAVVAYCRPSQFNDEDVNAALAVGVSQEEAHLVIAIACAFRMFNAYVKTVGNPGLESEDSYRAMGEQLALDGYQLTL